MHYHPSLELTGVPCSKLHDCVAPARPGAFHHVKVYFSVDTTGVTALPKLLDAGILEVAVEGTSSSNAEVRQFFSCAVTIYQSAVNVAPQSWSIDIGYNRSY